MSRLSYSKRLLTLLTAAFAMIGLGVSAVLAAEVVDAQDVILSASANCEDADLDITFRSEDVDREYGKITNENGDVLGLFEQDSSFDNFNGTYEGYGQPVDPDQPDGTIIGSYAYIGQTPPSAQTTGEFFVLYRCDTDGNNDVLYTCAGPYGSCPKTALQGLAALNDDQILAGPPCMNLFDGRVNNDQSLDCAAPVAIYQNTALGTIDVYAINPTTGRGTLVIRLTPIAGPTDVNQTFEPVSNPFTGKIIQLFQLTSGEFQLMTEYADAKPYIVVWGAGTLRHLAA